MARKRGYSLQMNEVSHESSIIAQFVSLRRKKVLLEQLMGGFGNQNVLKKKTTKFIAIVSMQPPHSTCPFKNALGGLGVGKLFALISFQILRFLKGTWAKIHRKMKEIKTDWIKNVNISDSLKIRSRFSIARAASAIGISAF